MAFRCAVVAAVEVCFTDKVSRVKVRRQEDRRTDRQTNRRTADILPSAACSLVSVQTHSQQETAIFHPLSLNIS